MARYRAEWPDGQEIVFRDITRGEYIQLAPRYFSKSKFLRPMDVALEIYRKIVLSGPSIAEIPAGIPGWLATFVFKNNPFQGTYKLIRPALDQARHEVVSRWSVAAEALIASTFKITFEEIQTWDQRTFFLRLAQAEFISGRTLDPGNPADKPKPGEKPKRAKRPLTDAQQLVVDRTKKARQAH